MPGDLGGIGRAGLGLEGVAGLLSLVWMWAEHARDVVVFVGVQRLMVDGLSAVVGVWAVAELLTGRRSRTLWWLAALAAAFAIWLNLIQVWGVFIARRASVGLWDRMLLKEYATLAGAVAWSVSLLLLTWQSAGRRSPEQASASEGRVLGYARPGATEVEWPRAATAARWLLLADLVLYGAVAQFVNTAPLNQWSARELMTWTPLMAAYVVCATAILFASTPLLWAGVCLLAAAISLAYVVPALTSAAEGGRAVLENLSPAAVMFGLYSVVVYTSAAWVCWLILRRGSGPGAIEGSAVTPAARDT